jgi:hypothetical protein
VLALASVHEHGIADDEEHLAGVGMPNFNITARPGCTSDVPNVISAVFRQQRQTSCPANKAAVPVRRMTPNAAISNNCESLTLSFAEDPRPQVPCGALDALAAGRATTTRGGRRAPLGRRYSVCGR